MTNLRIETTKEFKDIKDNVDPIYKKLGLPTGKEIVQNKYLSLFIDNKLVELSKLNYLEVNLSPGNIPVKSNLSYIGEVEYIKETNPTQWIPIKETWLPFNEEKFGNTIPQSTNLDFKLDAIPVENPLSISRGMDAQLTLGNKTINVNKLKLIIEKDKVPYLELRIPLSNLSVNLNADFNIITEE